MAACAAVLVGACAQPEGERLPASQAPNLGVLESVYDRAKWEWVKNADARMLLKHRELAQCFLDPEPPMDLNDPGLRVTRANRTFGAARYEVSTAYEGRDFWEAVYVRSGSPRPVLGVYAGGECPQQAEKILEAYEKNRGQTPVFGGRD